ncbi:hypothetical protein BVX98_00560 [bacterium F11]|nr:hypothetical protein BVX98_00560 [bacterium F11]
MKKHNQSGYTLLELMLVVIIIGILSSLVSPYFDLLIVKANQATTKNNLGIVRTSVNMYYTDTEGEWPLAEFPAGDTHYTAFGLSLMSVLRPKYTTTILTPNLKDRNPTYNGLSVGYDGSAKSLMSLDPPKDVFIVHGDPAYTPLLNSPFAYDNHTGHVYIPNGNYDTEGNYFFTW